MTRTSSALFAKFLITFAAAYLTVGLVNRNPIGWIFILAILGTIINYLIGDLMILPRTGSFFAALMDGVLSGLTAYILDLASKNFNTTLRGLGFFAILIMIAEYFFHRYLIHAKKVAP
jgi:hypothetical protein